MFFQLKSLQILLLFFFFLYGLVWSFIGPSLLFVCLSLNRAFPPLFALRLDFSIFLLFMGLMRIFALSFVCPLMGLFPPFMVFSILLAFYGSFILFFAVLWGLSLFLYPLMGVYLYFYAFWTFLYFSPLLWISLFLPLWVFFFCPCMGCFSIYCPFMGVSICVYSLIDLFSLYRFLSFIPTSSVFLSHMVDLFLSHFIGVFYSLRWVFISRGKAMKSRPSLS